MSTLNFVCVLFVAACINEVFSYENTEAEEQSSIEKPVGRAYSLARCDYSTQVGYTCLSCHRALHCYPGDLAILVDCYGGFRYCRDGRCSRHQGSKCGSDTKATTPTIAFNGTDPTFDITANTDGTAVESTKIVIEQVTETVSLPVDPNGSTKIDASSTTASLNVESNIV